jgi:hypothetical protein
VATGGALVAGTAALGATAAGEEPKAAKLWTLEGELKVHPKYLYRSYLMLGDGQTCALYGSDHGREPGQLSHLQLPVRVRVRGVRGTAHYPGGTRDNPSPFPERWTLYMDVHEAETLK